MKSIATAAGFAITLTLSVGCVQNADFTEADDSELGLALSMGLMQVAFGFSFDFRVTSIRDLSYSEPTCVERQENGDEVRFVMKDTCVLGPISSGEIRTDAAFLTTGTRPSRLEMIDFVPINIGPSKARYNGVRTIDGNVTHFDVEVSADGVSGSLDMSVECVPDGDRRSICKSDFDRSVGEIDGVGRFGIAFVGVLEGLDNGLPTQFMSDQELVLFADQELHLAQNVVGPACVTTDLDGEPFRVICLPQ